jgi:hypothetical protein
VPRDRIELSTPAFSGLTRIIYFQRVVRLADIKERKRASHKINGLQGAWAVKLPLPNTTRPGTNQFVSTVPFNALKPA